MIADLVRRLADDMGDGGERKRAGKKAEDGPRM